MSDTIKALLKQGFDILSDRLECEILLAHALNVERTYLHTWPLFVVGPEKQRLYYDFIERRSQGAPIAYIIGYKEFWSLRLKVTEAVLIPRPETEILVEAVLNRLPHQDTGIKMLDLGTGSGAIALALAHECPAWHILGIDKSFQALQVAKQNAKDLAVRNVDFCCATWFSALSLKNPVQAIVSNPPYIAAEDPHLKSGDLRFEPKDALISPQQGLQDLTEIIQKSFQHLASKGWLFLEHGYDQSEKIMALMKKNGYSNVQGFTDLADLNRVVIGQKP